MNVTEFRIKLYPKNYDLVRNFYEKQLQFTIVNEWDQGETNKGVMFDIGGTILEILTSQEEHSPIAGCSISLGVMDVWSLWKQFESGPNVIFKLRDNSWGDTSFCISDPEGFKITFFTKK